MVLGGLLKLDLFESGLLDPKLEEAPVGPVDASDDSKPKETPVGLA